MSERLKNILFYAFVMFFVNIALVDAQNDVIIHQTVDTAKVGIAIPIDVTVPEGIDSFQINVYEANVISDYYLVKINGSDVLSQGNSQLSKLNIDSIVNDRFNSSDVDFEISDFGKWKGRNNIVYTNGKGGKNRIKLIFWETGNFYILPSVFHQSDMLLPKSLHDFEPVFVPEVKRDTSMQSHDGLIDNYDIIREKVSWKDYLNWIIGIALLILIVLLLLYINKKRKKRDPNWVELKEKVVVRPAHEIALEKLKNLKQSKIWEDSTNIKAYQSKLTHILREYLENRYHVKALENTTGEILDSLSESSILEEDKKTIKNILQIADLVKFAKAKVDENIHERFLDETIDFVVRTQEKKELKDD